MSTDIPAVDLKQHNQQAEERFKKLSLGQVGIGCVTIGGWLIALGWYQATISDHSRRLDAIEQHQAAQEKVLLNIAVRVGAKTD